MKLGELRKLWKDIPDDADVLMDEGDLRWAEVVARAILPPDFGQGHSYAVLLEMGQVWNYELDLDARFDAYLGI